jgi:hypothetical protein
LRPKEHNSPLSFTLWVKNRILGIVLSDNKSAKVAHRASGSVGWDSRAEIGPVTAQVEIELAIVAAKDDPEPATSRLPVALGTYGVTGI